jgi:tRNA dimethylallyltransferase
LTEGIRPPEETGLHQYSSGKAISADERGDGDTAQLVAVVGPTGSGKSELAVVLAQAVDGEVVNFDSVQLYRSLDVGSAKIPVHERRGVPHHLLDVIEPTEELTAGSYARIAAPVLEDLRERRKTAILVGGTGFYLRALINGLPPAPERDERLRERLRKIAERRPAVLHRLLRRVDQSAAARIHPNDHQKTIRAIEIALINSSPQSSAKPDPTYQPLLIGLNPNRAELCDRLNLRSTFLFENGLLDETARLLETGGGAATKALTTIGYKQAAAFLTGMLTREEALLEHQVKTRQYAKRQMTWFRKEANVHWLAGFGSDPAIQAEALALFKAGLHPSGC